MKSLRFAGVVDDAAEEDPAVERRQLVGQRARRPRRLPQGEVPRLRMRTHHIALRRTGMDDQWNFSKAEHYLIFQPLYLMFIYLNQSGYG